MGSSLAASLLDPAILFFAFGLFAGAVRSNLEIPAALSKFFSLYLLMSIGFKGGVTLAKTGLTQDMVLTLLAALLLAVVIPLWSFLVLRRRLDPFNAAAIAATYGSVSAVTFITASGYLEREGIAAGGYMSVALVLMESPAILMAVLLANHVRRGIAEGRIPGSVVPRPGPSGGTGKVLHEAFTDGAQMLLIGSLVIGFLTGEAGRVVLDPFTGQLQKGILAFFLLEMGLLVAMRGRELRAEGKLPGLFLLGFGLLAPLLNGLLATGLAALLGLSLGDTFLLVVLAASASYIVVPAVLRQAMPEADAGLYFGMALCVTFPFNIIVGLPLYLGVLQHWWS